MGRTSDRNWRNAAASALAASVVAELPRFESALVIGDATNTVSDAAETQGARVVSWGHRVGEGREVSTWPSGGPYDVVALRIPKAKDELELLVHAAFGCLPVRGRLLVYGAKDEGIGSARGRITPLFGSVDTAAVGKRCRVLSADRPESSTGLRSGLEAWEREGPRGWKSYPGVFAASALDEGTALLLANLPEITARMRVLDFGCGSGWIAARVLESCNTCDVDLLDIDAFAIAAAHANVPRGTCILGGLDEAPGPYDVILSNPPYHAGKGQHLGVLNDLIDRGAGILTPSGELRFVVQRRLSVEDALAQRFRHVRRVADRGVFRVWSGSRPR